MARRSSRSSPGCPSPKPSTLEVGYRLSDYQFGRDDQHLQDQRRICAVQLAALPGRLPEGEPRPEPGRAVHGQHPDAGCGVRRRSLLARQPHQPDLLRQLFGQSRGFQQRPAAEFDGHDRQCQCAKVEALCRQIMTTTGADTFYTAGRLYPTNTGDFFRSVSAGAKGLKAEDAVTYTIGGVLSSPIESPWLRSLRTVGRLL